MMIDRQRRGAHGTYLGLGLGKEVADVLLRLTDVLVQNLGACARGAGERGKGKVRCTEGARSRCTQTRYRTVHNLGLARAQHLADLPGHERLARAGRAKEEHTWCAGQRHEAAVSVTRVKQAARGSSYGPLTWRTPNSLKISIGRTRDANARRKMV